MRFLVILKATRKSEAGVPPTRDEVDRTIAFNEAMVKAGILLTAEGLHPSARGARIRREGEKKTVTDGPFAETKELVAGFWMIEVKSKDEAIEWMKRAPIEDGTEIELRQMLSAEDFTDEVLTPEARAKVEGMEAQAARQAK